MWTSEQKSTKFSSVKAVSNINRSFFLNERALPVANVTPPALILVSDINLRARRQRIKHVIFVMKEFSIYARRPRERDGSESNMSSTW
jgi:hypothetical protein